jgi:2-polyprenyl-3-methyl-5-hydroxy-6-metoxy-1,4-benzoquinol methylase
MEGFSKNKLDFVSENSLYTTPTNTATIKYSFSIFSRFLKSNMKILELGPAEGLMTEELIKLDPNLTVIEAASKFCRDLSNKFPSIKIYQNLFEEVEIKEKFDAIILGHVLEHVDNPLNILNKIKSWLQPNGIVCCAVPNARSIHRQIAVEMGLITSIFEKSEKDIHHGHLRIYTPELLYSEFLTKSYSIISSGGYWLKPISDSQIEKSWTNEMIQAFMVLGEQYPDIAGEIYVIAKVNEKDQGV